jgi:hypothetical protein
VLLLFLAINVIKKLILGLLPAELFDMLLPCLVLFWVHHVALALVPATLHHGAKRGRYRLPHVGLGSFAQYLPFANAFIGVGLCVAALLLGSNLNYSFWPPPLPAAVERMLGCVFCRVTVRLILSSSWGR